MKAIRKKWAALVACVFGFASLAHADEQKTLKVGDAFPDLSKLKVEGKWPELKGHVVLIDFWASWCPPCKKSFPYMKYLHERFANRGLVVVGISLDDYAAPMEAFLKQEPMPFPIVRDSEGEIPELLGIDRLPYSFLISPEGKILAIHTKFNTDQTPIQYVEELKTALTHSHP